MIRRRLRSLFFGRRLRSLICNCGQAPLELVAGLPILWFILTLLPFVNIVAMIYIGVKTAENFGKGVGFGVCLGLFPYVCYPILGFGSATYGGAAAAPPAPPKTGSVGR